MSFIENIKLIASELANMSPRTQLEIVKLCKELCIETKNYLVELDETTLANITTRISNLETATNNLNTLYNGLAEELQTAEGNITANANAIELLQSSVQAITEALEGIYTKTQVDALLSAKADKLDTYTKNEINTMLANYYNKTEIDTALSGKANVNDVYSKSQVDTALSGKASLSGNNEYTGYNFFNNDNTKFRNGIDICDTNDENATRISYSRINGSDFINIEKLNIEDKLEVHGNSQFEGGYDYVFEDGMHDIYVDDNGTSLQDKFDAKQNKLYLVNILDGDEYSHSQFLITNIFNLQTNVRYSFDDTHTSEEISKFYNLFNNIYNKYKIANTPFKNDCGFIADDFNIATDKYFICEMSKTNDEITISIHNETGYQTISKISQNAITNISNYIYLEIIEL